MSAFKILHFEVNSVAFNSSNSPQKSSHDTYRTCLDVTLLLIELSNELSASKFLQVSRSFSWLGMSFKRFFFTYSI